MAPRRLLSCGDSGCHADRTSLRHTVYQRFGEIAGAIGTSAANAVMIEVIAALDVVIHGESPSGGLSRCAENLKNNSWCLLAISTP